MRFLWKRDRFAPRKLFSILPRIGDYTKSAEIIDLAMKLSDICPDCMRRIIEFSQNALEG